jgi:hypothetical protein
MRGRPFPFISVRIPRDLRGAGTERAHILGELQYFSSTVQRKSVRGQGVPELRVGGDRGVPDTIEVFSADWWPAGFSVLKSAGQQPVGRVAA